MEKVLGIGGFFFKAKDPTGLSEWYKKHFGISEVPTDYGQEPWRQEAGYTIFAPFPLNTEYFGDSKNIWMINFRVKSLDETVGYLRAEGIEVEIDPTEYPNGRFARLYDPEGNPIELWGEK